MLSVVDKMDLDLMWDDEESVVIDLFKKIKGESEKEISDVKMDKYCKWYERVVVPKKRWKPRHGCTGERIEQWISGMEEYFGNDIDPGPKYGMVRGVLIVAIRNDDIHPCAFRYLEELREEKDA